MLVLKTFQFVLSNSEGFSEGRPFEQEGCVSFFDFCGDYNDAVGLWASAANILCFTHNYAHCVAVSFYTMYN